MSNPRVYVAIATFYPLVGGAERQAFTQSRSLRERGYAATIITFRHNRTWLPREVIEGVPIIRVAGILLGGREKLSRPLQKLLYLLALMVMGWKLWQHRCNYDILHVHQLNLLALVAALICRLNGKPMIVVVHCTPPDRETRTNSNVISALNTTRYWQFIEKRRIGSDLEDLERFGKYIVQFTHFLLLSIHAAVVIISSRMRSYLVTHDFDIPETHLIPNTVDITRFYPTPTVANTSRPTQIVVCVARLYYQKGIDVLLQAWQLVQQHIPQARLILVGDGPLRTQLELMSQALGLSESVEFAGMQSDILAALHCANIAVLPSRYEGMPYAILEAMACGLPCVATRVSGSEDIIQHGINGLLVDSEDYQAMAQALLTLLNDPLLAHNYGSAARVTIEKHYSLEKSIDKYIELYQRAINQKRGFRNIRKLSNTCSLLL